jgi:hypothetical protein
MGFPIQTTITGSGNNLSQVITFANDVLPDTLSGTITDNVGQQEDASFEEGQLVMRLKNNPKNIAFVLDEDSGILILLCATGDQDNYFIDDNGDLIYTIND